MRRQGRGFGGGVGGGGGGGGKGVGDSKKISGSTKKINDSIDFLRHAAESKLGKGGKNGASKARAR